MPQAVLEGKDTPQAAVFHKVGECLYRNESSGIYYALVKRSGKQYRRSLKTQKELLEALFANYDRLDEDLKQSFL